jgi:hypothetical protein
MKFLIVHLIAPCLKSLIDGVRSGDPYVQTGVAVTVGLVAAALVVRHFRRVAAQNMVWPENESVDARNDDFPA